MGDHCFELVFVYESHLAVFRNHENGLRKRARYYGGRRNYCTAWPFSTLCLGGRRGLNPIRKGPHDICSIPDVSPPRV